ncbi:hypothetical protein [Filibacter tadaridae]
MMDYKTSDEQVIQKYQEDEQLMIRLFIQWCANHNLDPHQLYKRAYPHQQENNTMKQLIKDAENNKIHIDNETMLDVLQVFGNDGLAFIVAEEIERLSRNS